jgi:type I restriction enzyme S subunit
MTNEVKNVPELRFPEFNYEWEEKMLGDVLTILDGDRGNNYPSQSDFLEFGHTLFLNASNVTKNGFSFKQKQYITEKKSISMGNGKLVKDDVVLTTRGSIGNIAWYDEEIYREIPYARINSGMLILRSNNKDMASFVSQFLKSIKGKRQIDRISFGSAQPQLTKKDIKLYRITFPQIKEQRKIGAFFSKLDRQIELEEEKLELLEQQRKGYMQKIFSQELRFKDENGNDYPEWKIKKLMQIAKVKTGSKNVQDNIQDGKYKFFDRSVEVKYLGSVAK